MKILGIGVDIVENSRIARSLKNNHFVQRVFTDSEVLIAKTIKNKKSYYSKRFAAKEAFAKSIGTGFRNNLNFKDISIVNDKVSHYSKRFAAKEAFSKAVGTGFRYDLNFKDISIQNNRLGKPSFIITDKIKRIVKKQFKLSNFNFFLSISDEKKYSVAYVVLQKK